MCRQRPTGCARYWERPYCCSRYIRERELVLRFEIKIGGACRIPLFKNNIHMAKGIVVEPCDILLQRSKGDRISGLHPQPAFNLTRGKPFVTLHFDSSHMRYNDKHLQRILAEVLLREYYLYQRIVVRAVPVGNDSGKGLHPVRSKRLMEEGGKTCLDRRVIEYREFPYDNALSGYAIGNYFIGSIHQYNRFKRRTYNLFTDILLLGSRRGSDGACSPCRWHMRGNGLVILGIDGAAKC